MMKGRLQMKLIPATAVNWVALDDRVWNFRPFEKRLIICPRSSGINLQVILALNNLSRTLFA
jgi:hypothetical protein